jgi:hypothetical protein
MLGLVQLAALELPINALFQPDDARVKGRERKGLAATGASADVPTAKAAGPPNCILAANASPPRSSAFLPS